MRSCSALVGNKQLNGIELIRLDADRQRVGARLAVFRPLA